LLVPVLAHAQPDASLAALPDGTYATQAWLGDRASDGFVYLLGVTGRPHGTLWEPRVRDLGVLPRAQIVRAVRARVPDERAASELVVEPIRGRSGEVLAYAVRSRDVQLSARFNGDGGYTIYLRGGRGTAESGGGGSGGGGGGM
jgi:hypothetical protein